MKTNFMIRPTSAFLFAAGVLCFGSLSNVIASENGIDPNSSEESSMKPPAGDETINAEDPRAAAQDKETSLQIRAEIPMFLSEPSISTSSSSERLSEYMLELIEAQNQQAAQGF